MNYHYLDTNNQPAGPVSLEEIRAMSAAGTIAPDPMICPVGGSEWKLMSVATGSSAPAGVKFQFSGTIMADFVGRLAKLVGGVLTPKLVEQALSLSRHFGQYAVLAAGVMGLIASIIVAIQNDSFTAFAMGIGFVIVLAVAQYAATRFLGASDSLIASTPSRLSSTAFVECLGVLLVLGAIAWLLTGTYSAIQEKDFMLFAVGLIGAVFLACLGAIALHPHMASVETGSGSAGEEAIGILAFGLKAVLKLVPLGFALLALLGSVVLIVGLIAPDSAFVYTLASMFQMYPTGRATATMMGMAVALGAALLPMMAYFTFLLSSLPLELWRAILSVPGKLDMLRRSEQRV